MKAFIQKQIRRSISTSVRSLMALFVFVCMSGFSQTLTQEFINAGYTLTNLGSINLLPSKYGGLTIRPEKPDTLYIGGYANDPPGFIYKVGLVRDTAHHVTGFSSDAIPYVAAPNNDGGLFFAPDGTLLFHQVQPE